MFWYGGVALWVGKVGVLVKFVGEVYVIKGCFVILRSFFSICVRRLIKEIFMFLRKKLVLKKVS